jgi:transposase
VNETITIEQFQALEAAHKELLTKFAALEHQYNLLLKLIYGSRHERFVAASVPEQLSLPFEGLVRPIAPEELPTEEINYTRTKQTKHKGRNELPEHLPVIEHVIEPDLESLDGYTCIGQEVTETIDYVPAALVKHRYIRRKYVQIVNPSEEGTANIVKGSLPYRPIYKGLAEAGLLAFLFVSKFVDHLPFHRIIQMFKRQYGWDISKSTINDWFAACCTLLKPLYEAYKAHVLDSDYLQADESPIKVLREDKAGKSHLGYMWLYRKPQDGSVLFDYRGGRGMDGPLDILKNFKGVLQCDGYGVYESVARKRPDISIASCLAHTRRKFKDSLDNHPALASHALELAQQLYTLERTYKNENLNAEEKAARRTAEARPIFMELLSWVDEQYKNNLSKDAIGAAFRYASQQLPKLEKYLSDGRIEIDNNRIENAVRPMALGRKNYLFCGSEEGAKRAAMMYTFFTSCKVNNVNPWEWLRYVLQNLEHYPQKRIHELFPCNWNPENKS